ncbi:urease accessory protein UreD [Marinivivus vitaminiproducens]|uniref:urease accessory protein UreD n=1 Tax=Marinivivus vitaminiproducens TaxID=3035935 RepID=UPI0027A3B644|nr:urease accessory protein UreD [Geminicoccaceae bacterium SCSIO 64248]
MFAPDGQGRTRLIRLMQRQPLRVLQPHVARDDLRQAVLINTGGGVVGGDRLRVRVSVATGGRALVTSQAAEKVYRSKGAAACLSTALSVGAGAWLEWLPQETILFDRSRLDRKLAIDVAPGGRGLFGETLVFGRTASRETLGDVHLRDHWRVRLDGRLIWADGFGLGEDVTDRLADPFGLAGARAMATALHVAADAPSRLPLARAILAEGGDPGCRAAATSMPGVLLVRWLGADAAAVRRSFGAFWSGFRSVVERLPAEMPTVWRI